MPCRDLDWPEHALCFTQEEYREIKSDLDNVTRMLCGVLGQIADAKEKGLHSDHLSLSQVKGLEEWWAHHQQRDAEEQLKAKTKHLISIKDRIAKIHDLGGKPTPELLEEFEHVEAMVKVMGSKIKKAGGSTEIYAGPRRRRGRR